jgi:hypothetical protein
LFYTCDNCTNMAGECPDVIHPSQLGDHSYYAYVQVEDINDYYATVCARGAKISKISKKIRDEAWGMREFGLVTVDGHRIMFASTLG